MKVCTDCGQNKRNSEFYKEKRNSHGLTSHCKLCFLKRQADYKKRLPDNYKEKQRRYQLKRTYGITLEQYNELFEKQKGCCPICLRHQDVLRKRLAVEHNHRTAEIRGLACDYCNRFVIGRENDPALFIRAAEFVSRGTGWFVPPKKKKRKRGKNSPRRTR